MSKYEFNWKERYAEDGSLRKSIMAYLGDNYRKSLKECKEDITHALILFTSIDGFNGSEPIEITQMYLVADDGSSPYEEPEICKSALEYTWQMCLWEVTN